MTREEAIKIVRNIYQTDAEKEALATLIPELAESEDERIIRTLQDYVKNRNWPLNGPTQDEVLAYLEKQKDARKAIEAVDRIDKYIDEHLANAHDMKDSSPDKKYYRGWDDALGEMARILQDVYSGEKQKEQKQECGEKGINGPQEIGDWRGDEGVCKKQKEQNGEDEECTDFTIYHPLKNGKGEYECIPYSFYDSLTFFSEDKDLIDFHRTCFYTEEECNEWIEQHKEEEGYEAIPVESTLEYKLGFKAGKESEKQKEQEHICDSTQYEEGFKTGLEIGLRSHNDWSEEDSDNLERVDNYLWMLDRYVGDDCATPQGKTDKIRGNIQGILSPWLKNLPKRFTLQPKQEWNEEERIILDSIIDDYEKAAKSFCGYAGKIWFLKAIRDGEITFQSPQKLDASKLENFDPVDVLNRIKTEWPMAWEKVVGNQEWSEEDERIMNGIQLVLESWDRSHVSSAGLPSLVPKYISWLKDLRPYWKPSEEHLKYLLMLADYFESEGGTSNAKTLREFSEDLRKLI